jgi:hypothetical protein
MTLPHETTRQGLAGLYRGLWHEKINLGDSSNRYWPGRTSTFLDAERRTPPSDGTVRSKDLGLKHQFDDTQRPSTEVVEKARTRCGRWV